MLVWMTWLTIVAAGITALVVLRFQRRDDALIDPDLPRSTSVYLDGPP